jgi:hypothetical protein
MEPVMIGVVVGILVFGGCVLLTSYRKLRSISMTPMTMAKSSSSENLADMVAQEDPEPM